MCATRVQRTVVAHCSGTQCAPQVYSAQLLRTVLAHNVRHKSTAHSCRALFWHTMCATVQFSSSWISLLHKYTVHSCRALLWHTIWATPPSPPLLNTLQIFRAQEPKAPVTYCDHALSGVCRPSSVVRLSSVRLFTFSTSSPEPLDGFWWNLVWLKYSRSLTSVVVFRPDPPRGGSRAGQK